MANGQTTLTKVGGISLVASAALFFAAGILAVIIGPPPSSGAEILVWIVSRKLPLALVREVLFFAAGFLVPAVMALNQCLASTNRSQAASIGCGVMASTIPVLFVSLIVHGRLSYPIFGIRVHTPEIAEFTVGIYCGAMHAVVPSDSNTDVNSSLAWRAGTPAGRLIQKPA